MSTLIAGGVLGTNSLTGKQIPLLVLVLIAMTKDWIPVVVHGVQLVVSFVFNARA